MKKFGHPIYLLGVGLSFTISCLLSCEKAEEANHTDPTHTHPSDWDPTDKELLLGKEIYVVECALCHDEGEEGAPRLGKAELWTERLIKPEEEIISRAINGFVGEDGEMPAKGGSDYLTDAEVAAAVRFMIATPKH